MHKGTTEDWITALEGAGATGTGTVAKELSFLTAQGYTSGTLDDRWYQYLKAKGYTGGLQDMWQAADAADDLLSVSVAGDVDAWFTASKAGGFWQSTDAYQDDAQTTAASADSDPLKIWVNQRTTPYTGVTSDFGRLRAPALSNASLIKTGDATHGTVADCFRTGTQYAIMRQNGGNAGIGEPHILAMRLKVPSTLDGSGGGCKLGSLNGGQHLGITEWDSTINFSAGVDRINGVRLNNVVAYAGQWVTLIYLGDENQSGANKNRLYVNNDVLGSPDATKDLFTNAMGADLSLEVESNVSTTAGVLVYKMFAYEGVVDDIDLPTLKQWLEE